jgi:catechol 2,3-dioxygenase-like lactoylglutathione lyase family enzyme
MTIKIKDTNLTINVGDIEKSIRFYKSIGFELKEQWGNHYAQLTAQGIVIGLHPTKDASIHIDSGNLSVGFTTDDFEGVKKTLIDLGIELSERSEEGGLFLHFKDPDGTSLYFIDPKW